MSWLRALLRRFRHRQPVPAPVRRTGLMTDWEFIRGSYRQGEAFDPLNAIISED